MTKQPIRVCHLLDQTLENRVGGVEFINHLLFHKNNNELFDHQIRDAHSFDQSEPYHLSKHLWDSNLDESINADIVHIHQIQPYGLKSLINLAKKTKTILTLHDYYLFCQKSTFYRENKSLCEKPSPFKCTICNSRNLKASLLPIFFYLRSKLAKQLLKHVKKIVLPNQELLKLIPAQFQSKCITVHYATPRTPVAPTKKNNYVYLGTLAPHKGIGSLIQDLKRSNFSEQLHVYSPNEFIEDQPSFVKHCGLLTDKSKLSQYKALIIPSKWKETGPIVLQEALNANTEVILYKSPISRDYSILNGVHSFTDCDQIANFKVKPFSNHSYSYSQLKNSLETLYQSLHLTT